jgi:hypothetical protein
MGGLVMNDGQDMDVNFFTPILYAVYYAKCERVNRGENPYQQIFFITNSLIYAGFIDIHPFNKVAK